MSLHIDQQTGFDSFANVYGIIQGQVGMTHRAR